MYIFIAKFTYGKGRLARAQVVKETPKTFKIDGYENILSRQYLSTKRILKDKRNIFHSRKEAVSYLVKRAEFYAASCEVKLKSAAEELCRLEEEQDAERQAG